MHITIQGTNTKKLFLIFFCLFIPVNLQNIWTDVIRSNLALISKNNNNMSKAKPAREIFSRDSR